MFYDALIQEVRTLLAEGKLEPALEALLAALRTHRDDSLYNEVVLLNFQHHEAEKHLKLGMIETEEYFGIATRISNAILTVILEDLAKPLPVDAAPARLSASGKLLHNIPGRMTTGVETRCTVRIAPDEAKLLRDFEVSPDTVVSDIELAKIMEVHVLPENDAAFKVRTFSSEKQVISTERANEWKFMVTPQLEGRHRLLLKVMVIEVINEKEYRRDTILEREVEIRSEAPPLSVSYSSSWEYANVTFNYARAAEEMVPVAPGSGSGEDADLPRPTKQPPPRLEPAAPPQAPASAAPPSAKRKAPFAGILAKAAVALILLGGAAWLVYILFLKKEAPPPEPVTGTRGDAWALFIEIDPAISPQAVLLNGEPFDFHRMSTSRWRLSVIPAKQRLTVEVEGLRGRCSGRIDMLRDSLELKLDCAVTGTPVPLLSVQILTRLPDPQILVDGQPAEARFRSMEGDWRMFETALVAGRHRFTVRQGSVSCSVDAEVSGNTRVRLPCVLEDPGPANGTEPEPPAPRQKTLSVTVETREAAFAGAQVLVDQTNYGALTSANGVQRRVVSGLAPGRHRFVLLAENRLSCTRELEIASDQTLAFSDCTPVVTLVVRPAMRRPEVRVNGNVVRDGKLDNRNKAETRIQLPLAFRENSRIQLEVSEGGRTCSSQVRLRNGMEVVLECKEEAPPARVVQIRLDDRARRSSRLFRVEINDGAFKKENILPTQGVLRLEVPQTLQIGYIEVFGTTGQGEAFLLCQIKPPRPADNPLEVQCNAMIID